MKPVLNQILNKVWNKLYIEDDKCYIISNGRLPPESEQYFYHIREYVGHLMVDKVIKDE